MTSKLVKESAFTLLFCTAAGLGGFFLQGECSTQGIALTLGGLAGMGWGMRGVFDAIATHRAAFRARMVERIRDSGICLPKAPKLQ